MAESLTLVEELKSAKFLFVDTETNGEDIRDGRGYLTGISIAGQVGREIKAAYFPFRHGTGGNLPDHVKDALSDLLTLPMPKGTHNTKFDIVSLRTIGIQIKGPVYCTMVLAHLLNENRPFSYSLNSVAAWYLGKEAENQKEISEELKKAIEKFGWANIPVPIMDPYAVRDAVLGFRLMARLWPLLKDENLLEYWKYKERFVDVIIAMEGRGVLVDTEVCEEQISVGETRMAEIVKELGGYVPSKPADLKILLLDKLKLPIVKVSEKTGKPSFDKYAMEEYDEMLERANSDIAKLILEYRGWQKSVSSNYRAYLELLSPDGALRPNYKLHGTKTGRLSCEKPNLQQIPRVSDKPWNGHMRKAFKARPGYVLLEADYSQLELRLGTAYAHETALLQVFEEGRDIFTEMSLSIGLPRHDTKTFVYTTQYGGGIRRIKNVFGISESKARRIREDYYTSYPGFRIVSDRARAKAITNGKIRLWSGRYRHFWDPEVEARKAFNSLIQGGAADIVERIMIRLYEEIDKPSNGECNMLLQVHDSVVFEVKKERVDFYKRLIHAMMEDVDAITDGDSFGVKFHVEIKEWAEND